MGGLEVRTAGRRYRRTRRLRDSSRGMVSVVGTLLSLLVFFTLFGIFLTQYLPLWMTDNESQFAAQTQTAMADLKSNLDLQVALNGPPVLATPFVMASQGVPLLAAPTPGVLNFIPSQPGVYANVTMNVGPGGGPRFSQNFSLGELQMFEPNRYYSPQTFVMEDDAVVESQSDTAQVLAFPLALAVNTSANYSAVTMSLVQLYGNATQTISSGTQEVYTHFLSVQSFVGNGLKGQPFNASFQIGTHYPCAWSMFLQTTMAKSALSPAHWSVTPSTCTASGGVAKTVTLKLTKVNSYTLILGQFAVVVGVGLG